MAKNCIFLSCDRDFIPILELCLDSMLKNYNGNYDIVVCHVNFLETEKIKLCKHKNIIFLENNITKNEIWPIMGHLSSNINPKVFYARFLIWSSDFFDQYDKVLHLDADMLVLNDLSDLFAFNNFTIVKEVYEWDDSVFLSETGKWKSESNWIYLNTKFTANCWMFLVPKKFRTKKNYKELIEILKVYKQDIKRADQSILNIRIAKNNINILSDFSYNFQHRLILDNKFNNQLKKASIIHFNGVNSVIRYKLMNFFLENSKNENILEKYLKFYNQTLLWTKK